MWFKALLKQMPYLTDSMAEIQFNHITRKVGKLKVAILGDAMMDMYISGHSSRLAREAPVPIVDIHEEEYVPGGAANAALNVAALGAQAMFVSVLGQDHEGELLKNYLAQHHVNVSAVIQSPMRRTLTKRRIVANAQTIMRLDSGTTSPLDVVTEKKLIQQLANIISDCDALIVSDYGYGCLTPTVIRALANFGKQTNVIITADSKQLSRFHDVHLTAVKPNYQEAVQLLHLSTEEILKDRVNQIEHFGERIFDIVDTQIAAFTLDKGGAMLWTNHHQVYRTYTKLVTEANTIGAGDTYTAALTVGLASGAQLTEVAEFASAASSIAVNKIGTAPCYLDELRTEEINAHKHVHSRQQLHDLVRTLRQSGKQIVFTNGCFDILHRGHIAYLNQAKALGDVLIVGMNTDASIQRLKGLARPINTLSDRIDVLSSLSSVDYIIPFHEDTPMTLIRSIQPDIFTKGGDYTAASLPEGNVVKQLGGRVEILPYIKKISTTTIINKIKHR